MVARGLAQCSVRHLATFFAEQGHHRPMPPVHGKSVASTDQAGSMVMHRPGQPFPPNNTRQVLERANLGTPIGVTNRPPPPNDSAAGQENVARSSPLPRVAPRGSGVPWARTSIAGSSATRHRDEEQWAMAIQGPAPPAPGS